MTSGSLIAVELSQRIKMKLLFSIVSWGSPGWSATIIIVLSLYVTAVAPDALGQSGEPGVMKMVIPSNTLSVSTNERIANRRGRAKPPIQTELLMTNSFCGKEAGIYVRWRIPIGDLQHLLHFEDSDMEPTPSASAMRSVYLVSFPNGRCLVSTSDAMTDIREAATLVDVLINTNAVPTGIKLTPRLAPANVRDKSIIATNVPGQTGKESDAPPIKSADKAAKRGGGAKSVLLYN